MNRTFKVEYEDFYGHDIVEYFNAKSVKEALAALYSKHDNFIVTIKDVDEYVSPYYYRGYYDDGEEVIYYYNDADQLFYWTSKEYAFMDIDPSLTIEEIVCDGVKCYYCGWAPGMVFNYCDDRTNQLVYSCSHEEWDH